jgi:hypothetical protein
MNNDQHMYIVQYCQYTVINESSTFQYVLACVALARKEEDCITVKKKKKWGGH